MFGTTMTLAADRFNQWVRCIVITTGIMASCFIQTGQADVSTQLLFQILSDDAFGPTPDTEAFSQEVAVEQVLQRLVRKPDGSFDAPYAIKLGFDFPPKDVEAAVKQAESAFPIALFRVGLKRLQQYQPMHPVFGNPLRLLADDANWLVDLPPPLPQTPLPARHLLAITVKDPVSGRKVVKSSVRLLTNPLLSSSSLTKLSFAIERFGSSALIIKLDKWRRSPAPPGAIDPRYFLVWIPALDRYYLGNIHNKEFLITAITDDRKVGLSEGQKDKAVEVFRKLKTEALTINAYDPDEPQR